MADKEQVYVKCDDGTVMLHDLPLPSGVADRVARGQLHLVNADGSAIEQAPPQAPASDSNEMPTGSIAVVLAWVGEDKEKAQRALDAEQAAEKPRKGVVSALEEILTDPSE